MSYLPLSIFNFISLLHLHLLIYSINFSIHKYIDLLRPYIDPTSPPQFLLFSLHDHHHRHYISIVLPLHHHHISIVFPPPPPPPHFYCFPPPHFFLIVFAPPPPPPPPPSPPPHFYCFPRKGQRSKSGLNIWVLPFRCDFGPFDLFEGKQ